VVPSTGLPNCSRVVSPSMPLKESLSRSRPTAASLINADAVDDVTQDGRGVVLHAAKASVRTPATARLAKSMATRRAVRAPTGDDIVS
jgi:hypothetical protein